MSASLDPKVREYLDSIAGLPASWDLPLAEGRRAMVESAPLIGGEPEVLASVEDVDAGGVPARLYRPVEGELPLLVFCHGGGWVFGDLETHDRVARTLARRSGWAVLSVDYRLAPEHAFPAAADDAWAATRWAAERFPAVAVGGDSAGGNLAAVAALRARDRGVPLAFQLLVYPVADHDFERTSYGDFAEGYGLTREAMRWFWDAYVPDAAQRLHQDASPLRAADLAGVAPALVLIAGADVLRDEGLAYACRLEEAGVPVALERYDGHIHGFLRMTAVFDVANEALDRAAAALRAAYAP